MKGLRRQSFFGTEMPVEKDKILWKAVGDDAYAEEAVTKIFIIKIFFK